MRGVLILDVSELSELAMIQRSYDVALKISELLVELVRVEGVKVGSRCGFGRIGWEVACGSLATCARAPAVVPGRWGRFFVDCLQLSKLSGDVVSPIGTLVLLRQVAVGIGP